MQHVEPRIGPVEEVARSQAERPASLVAQFGADEPLPLDAGVALAPFQIAYQTYGTLNPERSNAVLVCHALTGDQHVANVNVVTRRMFNSDENAVAVGGDLQIDLIGFEHQDRLARRNALAFLLQPARDSCLKDGFA